MGRIPSQIIWKLRFYFCIFINATFRCRCSLNPRSNRIATDSIWQKWTRNHVFLLFQELLNLSKGLIEDLRYGYNILKACFHPAVFFLHIYIKLFEFKAHSWVLWDGSTEFQLRNRYRKLRYSSKTVQHIKVNKYFFHLLMVLLIYTVAYFLVTTS